MSYLDIERKLKILGREATYDSCGLPQVFKSKWEDRFVYRAVGEGGTCVNLFKVLQTNACKNNCFYCANRRDRDFRRLSFDPSELAKIFWEYYRKKKVQGLFLSSGLGKNVNLTQELMLETIRILRFNYGYHGYIHFKILPGVDKKMIWQAARLSDRISLNLEAPGESYLKMLSPEKDFGRIILPALEEMVLVNRISPLKSGITTQLIVGAGKEKDKEIIYFVDKLYKRYGLTRVYYSGFTPVEDTPLENIPPCPSLREFRLYQVDFLLRRYGFKKEEIVFDDKGNLFLDIDPKLAWAKAHPEEFPIEINKADLNRLMRIPGIGRRSAEKIINFRKIRKISDLRTLSKLIPSVKKCQNFITLNGKFFPSRESPPLLEKQLFLWEEI